MRVEIEVKVFFATPFNVGSGAVAGSFANRPLLRDKRGWPFIPASSFKGKLRHECERLVQGLAGEGWKYNCHPPNPNRMCQGRWPDDFCPVCRVFGSPWHPSPLRFSDLKLVSPAFLTEEEKKGENAPRPVTRHGVGLSRRRHVAEEAHLFTTEVFLPGAELEFSGGIEGQLDEEGLALVLAGLRAIVSLGGDRTGGLGWCRLQAIPYQVTTDGARQEVGEEMIKEGMRKWQR